VSSSDILGWQKFVNSSAYKERIAAIKREDEEDEERQRQEEEQDYESDPDLTRGEMERMKAEQESIVKAFAEIGGMQVSHSRVVEQMLDPLLREESLGKNREEYLRTAKLSTTSPSDVDNVDFDNKVIDGGQPKWVGVKTDEVMTTGGLAKTEEGTTRVGAKTEEATTTTVTTTTAQTSVRTPQCKEGSLGKKSQATYPRSRTEPESGKVDTQGSQKFRRRKRDNETGTAVVKGGGGLYYDGYDDDDDDDDEEERRRKI